MGWHTICKLMLPVLLVCIGIGLTSGRHCPSHLAPSAHLVQHGWLGTRNDPFYEIVCDSGDVRVLRCFSPVIGWQPDPRGGCPEPLCPEPETPNDKVYMTLTGRRLNDTVKFTCKRGLVGSPVLLKCQREEEKNGEGMQCFWKSLNITASGDALTTPPCSAQPGETLCILPVSPHRIVVDDFELMYGHHAYVEWDEIQLGCEEGYQIIGESWIMCDQDGEWDIELPNCQEAVCTLPYIEHLQTQLNGLDFSYGQEVDLACGENYLLVPYTSTVLECTGKDTENGGWDGEIPECHAVRCTPIQRVEDGEVDFWAGPLHRTQPRVGSKVHVRCNPGFHLIGPSVRMCTPEGTWDGTLQICDDESSDCGNPGTPIGGSKLDISYNVGDVVRFRCNRGYSMLGSSSRTCLPQGLWSGRETRCIGRHEFMTMAEVQKTMDEGFVTISQKTVDSQLEHEKLNDLMGKDLQFGGRNMKYVSRFSRTTIEGLQALGGLDIYFALDTSGSIPKADRDKSVEIIKAIMAKLGISRHKDGTGFGFVAFNNTAWITSAVADINSLAEANRMLDGISRKATKKGGTAPAEAIREIKTLMASVKPENLKKTVAVVMLTDAKKNEGGDPAVEMNLLIEERKRQGQEVHIYCLGVADVDVASLQEMASKGQEYIITRVRDWQVYNLVSKLLFNSTDFSKCGVAGYAGNETHVFAEEGEWRWMGGMYISASRKPIIDDQLKVSKFECGLSLISKAPGSRSSDIAVTAAHCVIDTTPEQIILKFGSLYRKIPDENGVFTRVKAIKRRHDFDKITYANDIALLQLQTTIRFSLDIRPVCLPHANQINGLYRVHKPAKVTGWGYWNDTEGFQSLQSRLKDLDVKIESSESCQYAAKDVKFKKFKHGLNFCAGGVERDGQVLDACQKDSGGPLVASYIDEEGYKRWTQIGIVSFGDGCGKRGKPGVYTNLTTYVDWITDAINTVGSWNNDGK